MKRGPFPSRRLVVRDLRSAQDSLSAAARALFDFSRASQLNGGPAAAVRRVALAVDRVWLSLDDVLRLVAAVDDRWRALIEKSPRA